MYFFEDTHTYVHKVTEEIYPSVTTLLKKYKHEFDTVGQSEKYVLKHPELQTVEGVKVLIDKYRINATPEELLKTPITAERLRKMWSDAAIAGQIKGNNFHFRNEIESIHNESGLSSNYNDYIFDLTDDLKDGVYPELRIWSDIYKIAGTIDKVTIKRPYVYIDDYKTNKNEITNFSFNKKMKHPLESLNDSTKSHYDLQLSIYAYILQGWGYRPVSLRILHKRFMDHEEVPKVFLKNYWETEESVKKMRYIDVNYDPNLIKTLLEYDKEQRKQA